MLKKKSVMLLFLLLLLLAGGVLYLRKTGKPEKAGQEAAYKQFLINKEEWKQKHFVGPPAPVNAPEGAQDQGPGPSTLDLALKNISLSQGEGGSELWRLKAEAANMIKQDEKIFVEEPKLTYFMKDDGKVMHVTSKSGDIDQKSNVIRFINNVKVNQDQKAFFGDMLIYDGAVKIMTFPHGGSFDDEGMSGRADSVVWEINSRKITATGEVDVFFNGAATQVKNHARPDQSNKE